MLKKQAMKELALRYRPREKASKLGVQALNNHELLAMIIGSGRQDCNVLELAKKVDKQLSSKQQASYIELTKIRGIGEVLAYKILASLELGERLANGQQRPSFAINQAQQIFTLALAWRCRKQEHCVVFYLNGRQELINQKTIAIGGLNYNFLEPRDIFEPAFQCGASHFILAHNHPSGDSQPSDDDLLLTEKVLNLADLMGISLLDHVIVCAKSFTSLRKSHAGLWRT